MNDTSKKILHKQFEIIASIPLQKRLEGLFEMTELSRRIIQDRIKSGNPDITKIDLQVETFKTFYRQDYSERTLNQIAGSIRHYLTKSPGISSS